MLEEISFEVIQILIHLFNLFLICSVILAHWLFHLCLTLGLVQVLLSSELSIENSGHYFFFLWLQSLIIERPA